MKRREESAREYKETIAYTELRPEELDKRTFDSIVNKYIIENDIKLQDVVDRTGIPNEYFSRYISGARVPDRHAALEVAMGLLMDAKDRDRLLESWPVQAVRINVTCGPYDRLVKEYWDDIMVEFRNSKNIHSLNKKIIELNEKIKEVNERLWEANKDKSEEIRKRAEYKIFFKNRYE